MDEDFRFRSTHKLGLSSLDWTVYKIREAQRRQNDREHTARLEDLLQKSEKGVSLTKEEEEYIQQFEHPLLESFDKLEKINIKCTDILSGKLKFFSRTGQALAWYYRNEHGNYELFTNHGHHPIFNVSLKPINTKVIQSLVVKCKRELTNNKLENMRRLEELAIQKQRLKEHESKRLKKLAYQRQRLKDEEARKFVNLISKYNNEEWVGKAIWSDTLSNKKVLIEYASESNNIAAHIVSRLQRIGTLVKYKNVSSIGKRSEIAEIRYPTSAFVQATDIQASLIDIIRLQMNSDPLIKSIVVRIY